MKLGVIVNAAEAQAEMNRTLANAQNAIIGGITESVNEAKNSVRAMTRSAFKSGRLPNSWQSKIYGRDSFNPAGMIYSKAPVIMRAFSEGTLIKSADGFFLAVPTENCPKSYTGKRVTPMNWPKEVYGPLEFIYVGHGKPSMLAATNAPGASESRRTRSILGRQIRGGARGKITLEKMVMFILLPQVKLDKRIDPERVIKAAGDAIPDRITARLKGGKE